MCVIYQFASWFSVLKKLSDNFTFFAVMCFKWKEGWAGNLLASLAPLCYVIQLPNIYFCCNITGSTVLLCIAAQLKALKIYAYAFVVKRWSRVINHIQNVLDCDPLLNVVFTLLCLPLVLSQFLLKVLLLVVFKFKYLMSFMVLSPLVFLLLNGCVSSI